MFPAVQSLLLGSTQGRRVPGLFTLDMFGWLPGLDIGAAAQAAINAALDQGNSLVLLPPGSLRCDRNLDVLPVVSGVDPGTHGITIAGAGEPSTDVFFHAGSEGFRFLGGPVLGGKNRVVRPTLRDLSITCNGGARGVVLQETLFATIMNVWVSRAGIGVDITDMGEGCQNTRLLFVTSQLNDTNFHVRQALQLTALGCISNQGTSKGWHIEQCNGTELVGGMVQDHGIPLHVQPSGFAAVQLTLNGVVYAECSTAHVIQIDAAPAGPGYTGNVSIVGGMTVQGGHVEAEAVISAHGAHLSVLCPISAPDWPLLLRARNMDGINLLGTYTSDVYDIDADSLTRTSMLGAGAWNCGGTPIRTASGRLQVWVAGVWRTLALEP